MSLRDTSASDEVSALESLRDRLAGDIDDCESARDVASLSARYVEVLKRISEIQGKAPAERSAVDEIAARRRRRPVKDGAKREA